MVPTILPETENPRFNPCYYPTVYGVSPRSFPLVVSRGKSLDPSREFAGIDTRGICYAV